MPMVSLKLMAGAARSMVVASAISLREVRRLPKRLPAEIAARWTDSVQGRGSGVGPREAIPGGFATEEHSNYSPRCFFHLDKHCVSTRCGARGR
jgi:hypothetical protein